jgi:type VI secretion system protein ImpL
LLLYLILSWFLGTWLNLKGSDLWILRGGLAFLGLVAAGSFLWFYHRSRKDSGADAGGSAAGGDDLDLLVHEAVTRLRNSNLGRSASLAKLPLVFVLGESGSIKTSTIVNSGLEAELLAGHAMQDKQILPTSIANFWYTRQAVFVDTGGDFVSQAGRWSRLIRLIQPSRISSLVGEGQQAPRAALVCFSLEEFSQPGGSQKLTATARNIGARLQEVSRQLGISFPVYVLFTKLDRLPSFAEYVETFSRDEATQVLGTTLPVRTQQSSGVYAEEETRRLTKAFDDLFYSLAEKRMEFLARESQPDKLPGVYEFPRELRKLRASLVQFLVDLGRPSQLQTNPFLRGFYFSGVRAVVVEEAAPAAFEAAAPRPAFDAAATRLFTERPAAQQPPVAGRTVSRRVPQWVFLPHLFNDVILKDKAAFATSGVSSKVNLARRVALIAAASLCVLVSLCFLVSFLGNHALKSNLVEAANHISTSRVAPGQLASTSDLEQLEQLRQQLVTLSRYQKDGAPLHLRWGLFVGSQLYPHAREIYFAKFRQMLLAQTQDQMLATLRALPDSPGPNDTYEKAYTALKAYLITTSEHTHSTSQFLTPALLSYWAGSRELDSRQSDLARQQFDFYADELAAENPYASDHDPLAVSRARIYLSKFSGIDRYYFPLLNEAERQAQAVSFNRTFKDSADVVTNRYEVKGAFTREGFAFMQTALRQPSRYISSEEWVVGKSAAESLDPARLQQELSDRYYKDFISEWRNVLKATTVLGYNSLRDAETKLRKLASPASPLLELMWFVSHNTDVDQQQIKDAFQSVQSVQPPGPPDKYIQDPNQQYVSALTNLQSAIGLLANSPTGTGDTGLVNQTLGAATEGHKAVGQAAQKFRVDPDSHLETVTQNLLEAPIQHAEALIKLGPRDALNGSGRQFCSQFSALTQMYPFNPTSPTDVSLDQFNQMFAPGTGALWTFYDTKLKSFLAKEGTRYVPATSGTINLSPQFVAFFNRAAAVSDALYPAGSPTPKLNYSLKLLPSNVEGLTLKVGNATLSGTGTSKSFTWTGADDVQVTTKGGDILASHNGPWSIYHFIADAHLKGSGDITELEWVLQSNGRIIMLPNGKPKSYSYELQVHGFNPLRPGELSGLRCVAQVAR